ncbi:AMP-binding protein [Lacinutrix chionoecetis]
MSAYTKVHERFKYNNVHYSFNELNALALSLRNESESFKNEIGRFLLSWVENNPVIKLKTSGSTGTPKTILVNKQAMVNSALSTGSFFNLRPGDKALLCLPAHYIAGKMMFVRAMILGLELDSIEPKSILEIDENKFYDFVALVPMQVEKNINKLQHIKTVIIGGAKVSGELQNLLRGLKTAFFETYGMTETVSHIAVKVLKHSENNYFRTLPNISISQDERQCLVIHAPSISDKTIITNDVVKLRSKTEFEWLGRLDNIINSGGVKIFPEQIEHILSAKIKNRFFIASEQDSVLGERVILIVEGKENSIINTIFNNLESFSKPKLVYYVDEFVDTVSGKVKRKDTLKKIKNT